MSGTICYFGLRLEYDEGAKYVFFMWNLFLTLLVAESICLLIAAVGKYFIVGIAVGAFVFGAFMVVEGFFIKYEDIPRAWRWVHWVAFHSYSFANFMYNEFEDKTILANPTAVPPTFQNYPGMNVLRDYNF